MKKTVREILEAIMAERKMSKAELGRTIGVVSAEEAKEKPSKATDTINKRLGQKNISVKLLLSMLNAMGYTIAIVPSGRKLKDDEYEVTINE
jgi:hypothetical protein